MRTADFHEDDFCQIQLLPVANWEHVQAEFLRLNAFSQAHRAPDGGGWTDMYVRRPSPWPLERLKLDIEALGTCLAPHLPPFDRVTTGWSSVAEELPRCRAWGNSASFVIFADFTDAGVVQHLWLNAGVSASEVDSARAVFAALPAAPELFLVDWNWTRALRLADADGLRRYLQAGDDEEGE